MSQPEKTSASRGHGNGKSKAKYVLVIHGGAGTMTKKSSTPEKVAAYRSGLCGEAMDAAIAAVTVMEDNELFNAGKGAVFNVNGENELEASLMVSKPPASHPEIPPARRGLGLTLLKRIRNPAKLARSLYLNPSLAPHTFLSGANAESLAGGQRME
ncbi:asparaginase family protein [Moniliophthora roreri MCA 2997]|uniref:Asparaginase family protein n=2 Tax=Moniliophthora roreri TaxID=221103 RepID=V2XK99_MONRO|nr:asparaginase family protein [Moniliophthora roreri MCA 2997]